LPPLADDGPNFPATITANPQNERSVLAQPQSAQQFQQPPAATAAATAADEKWDFGWDGNRASQPAQQATIGNRYNAASQASAQPSAAPTLSTQPFAGQTQSAQSSPTFGIGAFDKTGWPEDPTARASTGGSGAAASASAPPAGPLNVNVGAQPAASPGTPVGMPPNVANPGLTTNAAGQLDAAAPTLQTPAGEQLPWMPLVVVSLALAGSIGANLFLGYSYADARHKYRTLVQKTANKFRRAAAAQ
jgi:hypothetical protein